MCWIESMVGGTIFHRDVIQREISRALVLNLSGKTRCSGTAEEIFVLDNAFALIEGHPAIHYLQLSFAKRLRSRRPPDKPETFWQKRYYDRNVRNYREFTVKLRYLHRNPVKRGLVLKPEEWKWSSYRHYALWETGSVEIESEWTARDREQKACGAAGRMFLRPG